MKTVIIDYGAGNVFSVQSALARLGVNGFLTNEKMKFYRLTESYSLELAMLHQH